MNDRQLSSIVQGDCDLLQRVLHELDAHYPSLSTALFDGRAASLCELHESNAFEYSCREPCAAGTKKLPRTPTPRRSTVHLRKVSGIASSETA